MLCLLPASWCCWPACWAWLLAACLVRTRDSLVRRLLQVAALVIVCTLGQQSTFDSVLYCIRINTFDCRSAYGPAMQLSYRNPPPKHDCENMDMPAVVTPSVNVTDMACVGHVVYTIAFPQLRGLTPTFAWLYIHMSVTRWDVTPRNACLWPQGSSAGAPTQMVIVRGF